MSTSLFESVQSNLILPITRPQGKIPMMPGHVHLDCCGAALGHSSQQLTIQGRNLEQARQIFDLLVPLAPVILALSAATPFLKGYLTDTDTRWSCISQGREELFISNFIDVYQ